MNKITYIAICFGDDFLIFHIVAPGDTVFSIANVYGVSPQRIITDNGLTGLSNLVVGQCIVILIPLITHQISAGDTLNSIAQEYGITISRLIRNNPSLIFNQTLIPGDFLTIEFENQTNDETEIYGYIYPYINQNLLSVWSLYSSKIAIFSHGFESDGTLIPLNDERSIQIMQNWGAEPYFLLSSITREGNFENEKTGILFNNVSVQNKLIESIIQVMEEKGYVGIDLDFEFINPDDRDAYVEFVRNVSSKLNPLGYSVNVDLAPKTSDEQKGTLYEGHNYTALANAANTVLLMTYEWGYTYGPPMAVAPINRVEEVVEYALANIDNSKIYLGIPNYGYDWLLPYERGVTRAATIGNEEAIRIAARYGSEIEFDTVSQTPFFKYTDLSGRIHEVWFEDARSIKAKFDLIKKYNLRGGGYWNFMRSFSQSWAYTNSTYIITKI